MQMQMHWSDMEYCRMIQYDFNKMVHSTKKLTGSPEIKVDLCVLWKSNFRTTDEIDMGNTNKFTYKAKSNYGSSQMRSNNNRFSSVSIVHRLVWSP